MRSTCSSSIEVGQDGRRRARGHGSFTGVVIASDHMAVPQRVPLGVRRHDVYAFPGASSDRIVLVLGTSSPITPAGTPNAAFGYKNEVLYQ